MNELFTTAIVPSPARIPGLIINIYSRLSGVSTSTAITSTLMVDLKFSLVKLFSVIVTKGLTRIGNLVSSHAIYI